MGERFELRLKYKTEVNGKDHLHASDLLVGSEWCCITR